MRSLGKSIRAIRVINGLTIEQVAKASGLSSSYVARIERDERDPSWSTVAVIAFALGVPVSTIAIIMERPSNPLNQETMVETVHSLVR